MTFSQLIDKIEDEQKRIKKAQRKVNATEGIRMDGRRAGLEWVIAWILEHLDSDDDQVTGITVVNEDGKYTPMIKCDVCGDQIIHGHCAKVHLYEDGSVEFLHVFPEGEDCGGDQFETHTVALDVFMYKLLRNTALNMQLAEDWIKMVEEHEKEWGKD